VERVPPKSIESPRQETTVWRRENRLEEILAKPLSGCARALVSLPRTVHGIAPIPTLVWSSAKCGFEPRLNLPIRRTVPANCHRGCWLIQI